VPIVVSWFIDMVRSVCAAEMKWSKYVCVYS